MKEIREKEILNIIRNQPGCSSKEIFGEQTLGISYATIKRILSKLVDQNYITVIGSGKGSKYFLSASFELLQIIDINTYYQKEIDERKIKASFNFEIFDIIQKQDIFSKNELQKLKNLQDQFTQNIKQLSEVEFKKDLERLAIDLSWKSSQIEGNTYTLLETERLLIDKETAAGKTREEALMLLNHKRAIDFIVTNPDYLSPVSVSKIEDIHSILMSELGIEKNIRKRRVGITGTNYKPLDNEHQIIEALNKMCNVVNNKETVFEKALLVLILISYIQPFIDGNKRTARIICNAVLLNDHYCPISFRTIDSMDYKKAVLLFYELNNVSAIKKIFIDQFEFAVNTYF